MSMNIERNNNTGPNLNININPPQQQEDRQALVQDNVFADQGIRYASNPRHDEQYDDPLPQARVVFGERQHGNDRLKDMNISNYNMLHSNRLDIHHINAWRNALGIPSLKAIFCKVCKRSNSHFWFKCPYLVCKICRDNHRTQDCIYFNRCDWCDGLHPSYLCSNPSGLKKKADSMKFCNICKRYGHPAGKCPNPYTKPKIYIKKRWNYNLRNKWKKNKGSKWNRKYKKY